MITSPRVLVITRRLDIMDYYRLNPTKEQRMETHRANYRTKLERVKANGGLNEKTFWKWVNRHKSQLDYQDRLAITMSVLRS